MAVEEVGVDDIMNEGGEEVRGGGEKSKEDDEGRRDGEEDMR